MLMSLLARLTFDICAHRLLEFFLKRMGVFFLACIRMIMAVYFGRKLVPFLNLVFFHIKICGG